MLGAAMPRDQAIRQAMRDIESANPDTLTGVFSDGDWGNRNLLPDATLKDLIEHFSSKNLSNASVAPDVFGQAYEYLIKRFADQSNKKAGEYYTPRSVVSLLVNILDPQGPIAAANKTILIDSIAIMLAIVVPTIIAIFAFAFYFRRSNTRAFHWPDWEYSGRLELVVWSIPALTIILLGGVAWIGSHQLDPARPVAGTGGSL